MSHWIVYACSYCHLQTLTSFAFFRSQILNLFSSLISNTFLSPLPCLSLASLRQTAEEYGVSEEDAEEEEDEALRIITEDGTYVSVVAEHILTQSLLDSFPCKQCHVSLFWRPRMTSRSVENIGSDKREERWDENIGSDKREERWNEKIEQRNCVQSFWAYCPSLFSTLYSSHPLCFSLFLSFSVSIFFLLSHTVHTHSLILPHDYFYFYFHFFQLPKHGGMLRTRRQWAK